MLIKYCAIIVLCAYSSVAVAATPPRLLTASAPEEGAVSLSLGDPAPFSGVLITKEKARAVYNLGLDLDAANKKFSLVQQENLLVSEQLTRSNTYIDTLSKQLAESKDNSFLSKAFFFLSGSLITGLISFGLVKTLR